MLDFPSLQCLIRESNRLGKLKDTVGLSGFSGASLLGMLQRFADHQGHHGDYLEIGVFQGLSLISTAVCLQGIAYGVDNFSQHDRDSTNRSIVERGIAQNNTKNVTLIDADYEEAFATLGSRLGNRKIALYFVDGPHDYRSQLYCLLAARPFLSEGAIIVVDDSNYRHVRLANSDFLALNPEYALLFEAYSECHPDNMTPDQIRSARAGWWNGVNVIVHDPTSRLERTCPPTLKSRRMFENDHLTQSGKLGVLAPELTTLLSAISAGKIRVAARQLGKVIVTARRIPEDLRGDFVAVNTWSRDLPSARFNPSLGDRSGAL